MADDLPPTGITWGDYVTRWVTDAGGWTALADQLIHRAGDAVDIPQDPGTVERGLRRLAHRHHRPGGQYGRWMLRFFGFTSPIERWLQWLGKDHSRFADLPAWMRLEQLALWNRPPLTESPLACWLHTGIASAYASQLDLDGCAHWLARAARHAATAGPAAELETGLQYAHLWLERGDHEAALARCDQLEHRLASATLEPLEEPCYRARLAHLRALSWTRPPAGQAPDVARARACYEAIPDAPIPFVAFRKAAGLAYCAWQQGDPELALRLAQRAVDEAGDGGLVRMRVVALNMLTRLLPPDRAQAANERARRMATALRDEDLLRRVARSTPAR